MEQNETELTDVIPSEPTKRQRCIPWHWWLTIVSIAVAVAILLTYTLTAAATRREYTQKLLEQQKIIDSLGGDGSPSAKNINLLDEILDQYSYYADELDAKTMLEAAFKAYVAASRDDYARYYTAEEYEQMRQESNGNYCGIGVGVVNDRVVYGGVERSVFRVTEVYENSPALQANLHVGDLIYAVEINGVLQTVSDVGFEAAKNAIRGEENTEAKLSVLRLQEGAYLPLDFAVMRQSFESVSVRSRLCEENPKLAIVQIAEFNLNTPTQFKERVNAMLEEGVEGFLFDVRDNPGGDLQSIKAILSYFLQEGDLVLEAKDKDGNVAARHTVGVSTLSGDYAACSVSAEEIGMYADLKMAILCNGNTASAAEVFVAALRDHRESRALDLVGIVGETTFGKGIMQTTRRISFEGMTGYVKLTTHAYVTACGTSYHGEGIEPTVQNTLSEEAKQYTIHLLPQSMDTQLKTAILLFGTQS